MGINISSLISKNKTITVSYPELENWKIEVAYVPREELIKIRKQAVKIAWDKKTRERTEQLDEAKFLELYADAVIKGWSGLRTKDLSALLPVTYKESEADAEVEYDPENALALLQHSPDFDRFITDVLNDVARFNDETKETNVKN